MKFNCIAVDDDVNGIEILSDYLSASPNFNLLQSYTDSLKAYSAIRKMDEIDVIFMDIEMPNMSGLDLAKIVKHKTKKLIITSAHSQYAIDAFDIEADAFLLKPYSLNKLNITLNKLFNLSDADTNLNNASEEYFYIKSKNEKFKLIKVRYEDIVAIESMQNNISIYTTNKTIVAKLTLTRLKEILKDQTHIIQVHRSFMISKKHIEEIENNVIHMHGNLRITLGENYREILLAYIRTKTVKTGRI